MNRVRQLSAAGLLGIVMIFELAAFALLSLRDESFDYKALAFAGGLIVVLLLQYIIILWISKYADRFILVIANLLAGIGMIVQYRLSYEVAFKQLVWFGIGIVAMIVCVLLMRVPKFFKTMDIPLMALSIAMLGVLLVRGLTLPGLRVPVLRVPVVYRPHRIPICGTRMRTALMRAAARVTRAKRATPCATWPSVRCPAKSLRSSGHPVPGNPQPSSCLPARLSDMKAMCCCPKCHPECGTKCWALC